MGHVCDMLTAQVALPIVHEYIRTSQVVLLTSVFYAEALDDLVHLKTFVSPVPEPLISKKDLHYGGPMAMPRCFCKEACQGIDY
jgi:hypothetical protein